MSRTDILYEGLRQWLVDARAPENIIWMLDELIYLMACRIVGKQE